MPDRPLVSAHIIGELRWDCYCGTLNASPNEDLGAADRIRKCTKCGLEYSFYLGVK